MKSFILFSVLLGLSSCASTREVHRQEYAEHRQERTFENEFADVWKGIEETFRKYKVVDRDPEEVDASELKQLTQRSLETDWIYTRSTDKYVEYEVNGFPRKKYLQTRAKYEVEAKSVMGGVSVSVEIEEEIEELKEDGTPLGYASVDSDDIDTSRSKEMLDRIGLEILKAHP